ncbi:DHA2 family efflux MFS transporter permease subunit [Phytohabitans houttuyneae]|uniref:MFS transporter n=1 Tax=Phytohabitans houttuyneae TaxID=1076126 RepID=UPI0031F116AE
MVKHAPPPLRAGIILALVCGAQFMVTLDIAIVNVALPSVQADLGLAQDDLQWVVITYGLVLGGLLLLGGRAADLLGRRRVLLSGLGIFTVASLCAGVSGSFWQLVASRAGQGLGAALTAPAALAILAATFAEGPARNRALGALGAVGGSAASAGVVLSGLLTAGPGWEWIFYLNVPVGVLMVALIVRYIPADRPAKSTGGRRQADVPGAVAVTAGLMAIVYAINKGVDRGWTSRTTLGFLAAGLALLALFLLIERRARQPLVPLSMFRRRTLNGANLVAVLVFASFFATIFQASLFMQQVLGYSALRTGFAYLAIATTAVVVAAGPSSRLIARLGPGWALAVGQACSAAGLLWLARVPVDAGYWSGLFAGFLLTGAGVGLSGVAVQVVAFTGIPREVSGLAGGMVETAREIGGALGTAVVASVAISVADGASPANLTDGFHGGSYVAAALNIAALLAAIVLLRHPTPAPTAAVPAASAAASPAAASPAAAAAPAGAVVPPAADLPHG